MIYFTRINSNIIGVNPLIKSFFLIEQHELLAMSIFYPNSLYSCI